MKLNPKKTTLLCISAARSYKPRTYIDIGAGDTEDIIISGKCMKLLGFHFDPRPTVDAHVCAVLKKVRYRTWSIHNLKRLRMSPSALIIIYENFVLPLLCLCLRGISFSAV